MTQQSTARSRVTLGALAIAALVVAACNSGAPSQAPASEAAQSQATATEAPAQSQATATEAPATGGGPNIFVVGGKPDDPFWSKVKKGVDDQAKVVEAYGGTVTWLGPQNYDNLGPDAAKLIQNAVAQNASGVIGPDWVPEAMDPAFQAVVAAKIPLVIYNSGGIEAAQRLGALNYVGNDEYVAGKGGGEYLAKNGAKNVLCINTLPGATNTEARCQGIADAMAAAGGKSTQLPLDSAKFGDTSAIAQAIKAELLKDPTIDAAVTISAGDATAAATGIEQAGATATVRLGSFDFDTTALDRIKAGTQLMAIDQQPYLQGSLATALLFDYLMFGNDLPTRPVATGPGIIDASNIAATLSGAELGAR